MTEVDDPDPLPPVEDEYAEAGEVVGSEPLPPPPVQEVTEVADPLEVPVFPGAGVEDLVVDGEAPPPSEPGGEEAPAGRLVSSFPLAVYEPEGLPEDPPGGGRLQDGEVEVPASVEVEVLDPGVAEDLGGVGLAFRLTRSDAGPTMGTVTGDVVYDGFRHAAGADMALRLQLVALPACVLSTPAAAGCGSRTVLDMVNLYADGILRGNLEVAPDPGPSGSSSSVVFVVETKAAGPAGDFSATPVAPNGRWDVGVGSGNFSWSEPLPSVPTPTGMGSGPSLSYSSQSVDGRVASSNNQASWAGLGWELSGGSITREYKSCSDLGQPESGDFCWHSENASITLNGVTSELVVLPGSDGTSGGCATTPGGG